MQSRYFLFAFKGLVPMLLSHDLLCADNRWLSSGGEYDDSWGVPRFMSLTDLMEPTKGFIYNDTLIVEAKINVVSTLKEFGVQKGNAAAV